MDNEVQQDYYLEVGGRPYGFIEFHDSGEARPTTYAVFGWRHCQVPVTAVDGWAILGIVPILIVGGILWLKCRRRRSPS
jgi:hypothetical protein